MTLDDFNDNCVERCSEFNKQNTEQLGDFFFDSLYMCVCVRVSMPHTHSSQSPGSSISLSTGIQRMEFQGDQECALPGPLFSSRCHRGVFYLQPGRLQLLLLLDEYNHPSISHCPPTLLLCSFNRLTVGLHERTR